MFKVGGAEHGGEGCEAGLPLRHGGQLPRGRGLFGRRHLARFLRGEERRALAPGTERFTALLGTGTRGRGLALALSVTGRVRGVTMSRVRGVLMTTAGDGHLSAKTGTGGRPTGDTARWGRKETCRLGVGWRGEITCCPGTKGVRACRAMGGDKDLGWFIKGDTWPSPPFTGMVSEGAGESIGWVAMGCR